MGHPSSNLGGTTICGRQEMKRKLIKKLKDIKERKPIAPPSIRFKSKKDYDRTINKNLIRKGDYNVT